MAKFKVYVSDYDYPDLSIEQAVLGPIGAEVIGLQCRTGEGLAEQAADADAILQQYARISRETIARLDSLQGDLSLWDRRRHRRSRGCARARHHRDQRSRLLSR
ncbi:hypothetical protein MTX20_28935 [Bradyrhizobium sp. ISRA435]|nr:hypothetical protein MTX20_28935 [Bradyrhizobium sp. ISRA435]